MNFTLSQKKNEFHIVMIWYFTLEPDFFHFLCLLSAQNSDSLRNGFQSFLDTCYKIVWWKIHILAFYCDSKAGILSSYLSDVFSCWRYIQSASTTSQLWSHLHFDARGKSKCYYDCKIVWTKSNVPWWNLTVQLSLVTDI